MARQFCRNSDLKHTAAFGRMAEELAYTYLQQQGLSGLARNFRYRGGEIDLVMNDGEVVVFVEVRSRRSEHFMHPLESIDAKKRSRLLKTGLYYIQQNALGQCTYRFDVVTITANSADPAKIQWYQNAFVS